MKNILFILMALISLPFIEACSIAPPSKTSPMNDGTCDIYLRLYYLELSKKSDTALIHKEIQESMSYFADKPMFDTTKFMRSCLIGNVKGEASYYSYDYSPYARADLTPLGYSIENSNAEMLQYLLAATKCEVNPYKPIYMDKAIDIFKDKKSNEAAEIIKILQKKGMALRLDEIIKTGDLETIKTLHENKVNLQECDRDCGLCSLRQCIDIAKQNSNKIYQYLEEQGYKTTEQLKAIAEQEKQEQEATLLREKQERIKEQALEKIAKITELLKANELEESIKECDIIPSPRIGEILTVGMPEIKFGDDSLKKEYSDLCEKQLVDKVRKLPKNKINSPVLASVYYDKYHYIQGKVFQNDGKMILITEIPFDNTAMVQISNPIIGNCVLTENKYIPFSGYVKSLGMKTYSSLFGIQNVPNYQLLFCGSLE